MAHTPGPWHVGHFARNDHPCNCTGIVSECYMGAVAEIIIGNGLSISDGGNDAPPPEEAKANARLIAAAPDMLEALILLDAWLKKPPFLPPRAAIEQARAAIAKATGNDR